MTPHQTLEEAYNALIKELIDYAFSEGAAKNNRLAINVILNTSALKAECRNKIGEYCLSNHILVQYKHPHFFINEVKFKFYIDHLNRPRSFLVSHVFRNFKNRKMPVLFLNYDSEHSGFLKDKWITLNPNKNRKRETKNQPETNQN